MKIRTVGAELFRANRWADGQAGGRTDGRTKSYDETNSRFMQFYERT